MDNENNSGKTWMFLSVINK